MTKDKEITTNSEKDEPVLTEWQRRNQEFLKKKEQDKAEQKKAEKRLQELRRAQFLGDSAETEEELNAEKTTEKKVKKEKRKKEPKPKKIKEKNPHRRRFIVVMVLAAIVLLFSVFMISPLSTSKTITVSGQEHTTAENIKKASAIKNDDYLTTVFWNRDLIAQKIVKNDLWVKQAQVMFQFPNHFTIKVKEYPIIAYRLQKDNYYPVLANGQVVDELATKVPEHFLSISLKTQKEVATFIKVRETLSKSIRKSIHSVANKPSKSTKDLVEIKMYDGNIVRVPLSKMAECMPYYSQVVKKMQVPGVIDMEVGIYVTDESVDTAGQQTQPTSETANSEVLVN